MASMDSSTAADWLPIFQNLSRDVISLCESTRTSATHEAEYANLLAQGLNNLNSQTLKINDQFPWGEEGVKLLRDIENKLVVTDDSQGRSEPVWQLSDDDVTHFVEAIDSLERSLNTALSRERARSRGITHLPVPAPPILYITKLHKLRDTLFPPPELGPWIDMERLRGWLNHCDGHHSEHCQSTSSSTSMSKHGPLRLIDVQRMCLTTPTSEARYAALSYVWGTRPAITSMKSNIAQLQIENALRPADSATKLPLELPPTIRDVIELTRQLGIPFLWVDSLCIVQDEDEERSTELRRMGSIYANAYLTIVAAGGTVFDGLRGVPDVSLPMKRAGHVPRYLRHGRDWNLRYELGTSCRKVQSSIWNRRAWTFQEQIFSRRLLVLDANSVTWECHCEVWLEGMDTVQRHCQNHVNRIAPGLSFGVEPSLDEYADHVVQYNSRQLTYPEDALDAFMGILSALSSTSFVDGFVCGLPSLFFDAALVWYNILPLELRRPTQQSVADQACLRHSQPSWSWTAWAGSIAFPSHADAVDSNTKSLVRWQYRSNDTDGWQLIRPTQEEEGEEREAPEMPYQQRLHLLHARPLRAFFKVIEVYDGIQLFLSTASGDHAGTLTSCETQPSAPDDSCEVVAVSQGVVQDLEVYNVIWIAWEEKVAYRKGVGRVMRSAWEATGLESIDLVLG